MASLDGIQSSLNYVVGLVVCVTFLVWKPFWENAAGVGHSSEKALAGFGHQFKLRTATAATHLSPGIQVQCARTA